MKALGKFAFKRVWRGAAVQRGYASSAFLQAPEKSTIYTRTGDKGTSMVILLTFLLHNCNTYVYIASCTTAKEK
jgi:hypothetical protein